MKYINREYGFSGRPPQFNDYYEETSRGPIINSNNFPAKSLVGAGLDPAVPYGAMLIGEGGSRWGIKISCNIRGRWIDSDDYLKEIGRLYAVSRDGKFTYFAYGDMTATVVKYSKNALVLSIASINTIKLRITFYLVKPCEGEIRSYENIIKGAANYCAVIPGKVDIYDQYSVYHDRYEVILDAKDKEYFTAKSYRNPIEIIKGEDTITYEYDLQGKDSRLFIYTAVGSQDIFSLYPEEDELIEGTSMEEIAYSTSKMIGRGILGRSANGFLNSSMYHRIYNPFVKGYMYTESRTKIDKLFAFKGTDLNSASIIASFIGDSATAKAQLELTTDEDILSPLTLWLVYCRTRDIDLLKNSYRDYARRYIPKGDLVISKDKKEVAYNMNGSPMKELNNHKEMYSLDKSCLNLLAMDIMERIALVVGAPENTMYAASKERLIEQINDKLWNSKLGLYMNKYTDGEYSNTIGITSFYPLFAGAVNGLDKLEKLIANLRDKKRFYGDRMIPTLSKDHPEYGIKFINYDEEVVYPYEGYRGMIVPYMNYLIYLGLIRYGVYDLAGELAAKSAVMWNDRYRKGNYEVLDKYLPARYIRFDRKSMKFDTDKIIKNTERQSMSGNLMALMGLAELIDLEYFRDDMGIALKFGTFVRGEHSVSRINLLGRLFNVSVNDLGMVLSTESVEVLRGDGGKFVVRQFIENKNGCEFIVVADGEINIKINLPLIGICEDITSLSFILQNGCSRIYIKNGKLNIVKIY